MKIKKKIISSVLSGITALSATLSCLPTYTFAAGGFNNISDTTYQINTLFGDFYDENSYTTTNAKVKENNISISENEYRKYCNDVVDGYNFTMSQNFNTDNQILYRNGKEYDPSSKTLCKEKDFFSYNDADVYGTFNGGGYDMDDPRSFIGVLDTVDGGRADAGYGGYVIDLNDSDKGTLSYLYRNCGTYTDEDKQSHSVDVKVTVVDYEESNDVTMSSTSTLFTQDEYNKLNATQKHYLTKLKTAITYKNKKYIYTVPFGYLSQASASGIFNVLGRENKFWTFKGAVMRFTPMRVGVDVSSVNWIELKYEFFEAGTNNPINVQGYSCWKDIDGYQGVSFPQGTMDKVGAWESKSHFLAHTFTKDGTVYNGYFDRIGTSTNDDDSFAWLYGTFSGKEITTLFSFCGPMDPTDPNKNRTQGIYDSKGNKASNYGDPRLRRKYSSSGTIMNDLLSVSLTGTLGINKYVQPLNGEKYIASFNNSPDVNKDLRFYLKDSKGYYVKLEKGLTEHGDDIAEMGCAYRYAGTSENYDEAGLAALGKSNVAWGDSLISLAGGAIIYNLPIDTYTIYETTAVNSSISKKIDISTVTTANMSVDNDGNSIWDTVNPNAVDSSMYDEVYGDILYKFVDVVNPENYAKLNVQKIVTAADGTTQNATYDNAEQLLKNIRFSITNERGEYARIENNKVTGFSKTASFFTLNQKGQINDIIIPFGKYTLNEQIAGNNVSNIWNIEKTVDFELSIDTCKHIKNEVYSYSINIDNPELYGSAKIQKTTSTGKDIARIRFTLSGTSDSGRAINLSGITDSKGQIIFDKVPVGTYTLKEDPETVPEGYKVAADITVKIDKNSTIENNSYTVINEYNNIGKITVYKYDSESKKALEGAEFTVYEDINGNGKYDREIDKSVGVMQYKSQGIFTISDLTIGKIYFVKETKAPDGYAIDNNYYSVTIDENHLEVRLDIPNVQLPVSITLTKRIPADEVNEQIWWEHGNPTFIFKLVNTTAGAEYNHTYYKTVEFTKDYVKDHTITIDGVKYVEMSVKFDNLKAGTYAASEQITGQRYELKSIMNVSNGAVNGSRCNFTLKPGQTGTATFYNVKNYYDTNTHNSLCVNVFKK